MKLSTILNALKKFFASKPKPAEPPPVVVIPPEQREPEQGELIPSENPAYNEAKKHEGKKETDSKFAAFLSAFWPKAGLNYKQIAGSSFAWCGLFILAMNSQTGLSYIKKAAGAKNWSLYGQAVDWKANGIPRGAVVRINHAGICDTKKGNHVTFADGHCTAEDLLKPGASFPGFGGNQQNQVNRTMYAVKEICDVRWPEEIPLPGKVTKSVDCSGKKSSGSTTR